MKNQTQTSSPLTTGRCPSCPFTYTHADPALVKRQVSRHRHRIHGYQSPEMIARAKYPCNQRRKKYTKRQEPVIPPPVEPEPEGCRNCPNCGYAIQLHNEAYKRITKLTRHYENKT